MKKILIALVTLISAVSSFAQGDNGWGIRAAFDINIPSKLSIDRTKVDEFRTGYGVTFGAVYSHWLNGSVFLEPGLSLFYDSYSFQDIQVDVHKVAKGPSLYKLGARIPLVIGYTYYLVDSFPMRVYTGPELSCAFAGKVNVKDKALEGIIDTDPFGKNGIMNRVDCAWKIGLGVDFDIASICVEAAMGMTDIYKGPMKCRDNRVAISLTHYF